MAQRKSGSRSGLTRTSSRRKPVVQPCSPSSHASSAASLVLPAPPTPDTTAIGDAPACWRPDAQCRRMSITPSSTKGTTRWRAWVTFSESRSRASRRYGGVSRGTGGGWTGSYRCLGLSRAATSMPTCQSPALSRRARAPARTASSKRSGAASRCPAKVTGSSATKLPGPVFSSIRSPTMSPTERMNGPPRSRRAPARTGTTTDAWLCSSPPVSTMTGSHPAATHPPASTSARSRHVPAAELPSTSCAGRITWKAEPSPAGE